jgi:hypothetical protein
MELVGASPRIVMTPLAELTSDPTRSWARRGEGGSRNREVGPSISERSVSFRRL